MFGSSSHIIPTVIFTFIKKQFIFIFEEIVWLVRTVTINHFVEEGLYNFCSL